MKRRNYIIIAIAIIALASCKQDNYYLYNDVARLQFGPEMSRIYQPTFNLADTTKNYSFFYAAPTRTQDTVFFDIYAIGGTSTKDRPFALQQEQVKDGSTNAVSGTDYKAFNDPTVANAYVIKAGQIHTFVPIVMLRSAALKTTTVTLKIVVAENSNFKMGEKSNTWRKVIFTDRLSQPTAWNAYWITYMLGPYSVAKHSFVIESTGQRWDDAFMTILYNDYGQMKYYQSVYKTALIVYNNAHPGNPLKDEFGAIIVFP
jgi:hypothetical protein